MNENEDDGEDCSRTSNKIDLLHQSKIDRVLLEHIERLVHSAAIPQEPTRETKGEYDQSNSIYPSIDVSLCRCTIIAGGIGSHTEAEEDED